MGEVRRVWGKKMQSGQASAKVKRAVCHGATRCPYEKGLGAAHGQVTTETKLGLELGASLPLWPPSSSLALPHPNYPWAAIPGCKDKLQGSRGEGKERHAGSSLGCHSSGVLTA